MINDHAFGPGRRAWPLVLGLALLTVLCIIGTFLLTHQFGRTDAEQRKSLQIPVSIREVDGGPNYYARFQNSLPTTAEFFPIGIWQESLTDPSDSPRDSSIGINVYVDLTSNSEPSLAAAQHSYALVSAPLSGGAGKVLSDEVDMWAGAGTAEWTGAGPGSGQACRPPGQGCGFTIQRELLKGVPETTLAYANYGKGVTFWQSPQEAAVFVNEFPDLVSADNYWFTDPNICGPSEGGSALGGGGLLPTEKCRLAANYGWTVEKIRTLISPSGSKPVWGFVEVGHPFGEEDAPTITGEELRAAVWSSLIHGARGIVYFNHNFGGPCPTQHLLREPCGDYIRPHVSAINTQLKALAPVLNAPFLDGATIATGPVDHSTKLLNGEVFVFAGANKAAGGAATFQLQCGGSSAVVLDENRKVPVINGSFTDTFANGNAVHLYRIEGGGSCGF